MKTLKYVLPGLIALAGITTLKAQTADEIIDKYVNAIGGKEKLSSVKSLFIENSLDISGTAGAGTVSIINGKAYKSEVDFNGQKVTRCITDKGGWGLNPYMGQTAAEAFPDDQVKAGHESMQIGGELFDYAAKGNKVELAGRENVSGANTYKIKLTTKDNIENIYFIDPNTYYIVKETSKSTAGGQESLITFVNSNYQKTDFGVVMPMTQEISFPQGFTVNVTNKKMEFNKEIDPAIFVLPK